MAARYWLHTPSREVVSTVLPLERLTMAARYWLHAPPREVVPVPANLSAAEPFASEVGSGDDDTMVRLVDTNRAAHVVLCRSSAHGNDASDALDGCLVRQAASWGINARSAGAGASGDDISPLKDSMLEDMLNPGEPVSMV